MSQLATTPDNPGLWLLALITLWVVLTLMVEFAETREFAAVLAWLISLSATFAVADDLLINAQQIFGQEQQGSAGSPTGVANV